MTKQKIEIRTSKDTIEKFDKNKIKETLIRETEANEKEANKITSEVENILRKSPLNYITTPMIRELTNSILLEKGYDTIRNKHTRFGVTAYNIETLIENGNKDNANMAQNPETIHKYVADESLKQYTLLNVLPHNLADAHLKGDLHCLSGRNKIVYKDNYGIHIERIDRFCESKLWTKRIVKVPSVNVSTGKISWQNVVDGKKTGHKPCFEVTFGKGFKIECTSDHKLHTYQTRLRKFSRDITPETYSNTHRIGTINKVEYNGGEHFHNYCALYGMYLGDGHYSNGKLTFHFKKQEKIDYVEKLLNRLEYDYHIVNNSDGTVTLIVDSIVDFNKSKENIFHDGFAGNMKGLLEGLINSDGYITKHGIYNKPYLEFTNTNREICDWFTLALMTLGLRPSFQNYINASGNPYYKCIISGDEIVRVLLDLELREPYKSLVQDYFNENLIGGKLYDHSGVTINDITPTGEKDVYNITVENNHNFICGVQGFVLVQNCHDLEYFASRPLNCVEGKTPVIIKNNDYYNIVPIETLFEEREKYSNIEVYTYNHEKECGEFQPVNAIIKNPKTKLLKITFGSGQQITVSEDHEFYTYSNGNRTVKPKINKNTVTAKELKERLKTYKNKPCVGYIKPKGIGLCEIDAKSKLIGFFLGDGGLNDNQAKFTLRKPDKISYIQSILNELGVTYTVYSTITKNNSIHNYEYTIVLKDKCLNEELRNLWLNDKRLPEDYITEETALGILSGLISSDGYLTINNTSKKPFLEFKTINENIKRTFETCCFLAGMKLVPHIQKRKEWSDIYNLIPSIYSSISLLKKMGLREKQREIIEPFEDEELRECTKVSILSVEEAGEDYVYTFNVHQNHNYLAGEGFVLNKNCLQHDLRLFIRYGLKVDGTGDHTSIASPPTHMETVMNHSGEILLAAQQNMSGGQAFSLWNVFVAPFAKGLSYERIKQCVEMFIFNLNMAYAARGGQVPFTSVGLEFTVPDFLKNETAYGCAGKACGVYGDYEEEVRLIQRAFTDVLLKGDANGKPHLFPNTIYYLRRECLTPEFEEDIDRVHYLSAKFGTAYYINMLPKYMGKHANYMGSVSHDTPILTRIDGEIQIIEAEEIFDWFTSEEINYDSELATYYIKVNETIKKDSIEFLTYNPDGSKCWKHLKTIMSKPPAPLYTIETENGKKIKVTPNHKIPVINNDGTITKVVSEKLKEGDKLFELINDSNKEPIIKSITLEENKTDSVFDFEIEDNHNYVAGWGFLHIENCRTRLSDNWTGDWETDTLRCGNLAYITLNLPRLAYRSKSEEEMFDLLEEQLENAKKILLIRRERAVKCLEDYKILPFLTQKFGGEPYYRVENSTLSFGFCGLNEMLLSMTGGGVANPESNKLGHKVIDYINNKVDELKGETPYRWSIIQTPAESTAYRFATMDRKMYPEQVICNGDSDASYYTNSNHLPVDTNLSLPEKIRIESEYHPKTQGGHIFHAFMGESYSDPDSLRSLTDKICHNSDIGFWAYSSALSYCNKCGTIMKGLQSTCTHCGETREVEWYDRITGYVQQVGHSKSASSGWNAGKKQELIDRRRFEQ